MFVLRRIRLLWTRPRSIVVRRAPRPPRTLAEFKDVNAHSGRAPVSRELSGLQTRPTTGIHRRALRVVVAVAYRWMPSEEWRRRQREMREANGWASSLPEELPVAPPILLYDEETSIVPMRLQALPTDRLDTPHLLPSGEPPRDLRDLEEAARLRAPRILQPRLPEMDHEYFMGYRPLLPRQYREFLRTSPYPRLAGGVAGVLIAVSGITWVMHTQQEGALASGRMHTVRSAALSALDAAAAYGVDPARLRPLRAQEHALAAVPPPDSLIAGRGAVRYYAAQARAYGRLLAGVRALERGAMAYWTWREGESYAHLMERVQDARGLGLTLPDPQIPACATPACFRASVTRESIRAAWLGQTAATLRSYAASVAASPDPAAAAETLIGEAQSLASLVRHQPALPARLAALDSALGAGGSAADFARAGALAHLDVDRLQAAFAAGLPARAVVISTEDGVLTVYQHGRAIYRASVVAGPAVPDGRFHIAGKQPSVPATFWLRTSGSYSYRYGAIPDWMPFSGADALQGAPWRAVSGASPNTPGSVDLPPDAATWLYDWVTPGTEVDIY